MSAKVIPLRGQAVPAAGVPSQDILDALHDAQTLAERGQVYGLAYVLLTPEGPIWAADGIIVPTTHDARMMVGCLAELSHCILGALED